MGGLGGGGEEGRNAIAWRLLRCFRGLRCRLWRGRCRALCRLFRISARFLPLFAASMYEVCEAQPPLPIPTTPTWLILLLPNRHITIKPTSSHTPSLHPPTTLSAAHSATSAQYTQYRPHHRGPTPANTSAAAPARPVILLVHHQIPHSSRC